MRKNTLQEARLLPEKFQPEILHPATTAPEGTPTAKFAKDCRKGLLTALTALSILSGAPEAFADDTAKTQTKGATKLANIQGIRLGEEPSPPPKSRRENRPPGEENSEPKKESNLMHHTLKAASVLGISKHPTAGFEATYSWTPSVDESKKLHFVVTPVDFMVTQHHLELEEPGHQHSTITRPKIFIGGLVGLSYLFNKFLEFEAGIGGGAAFIPYGQMRNGQFEGQSYQPTPILKLDTQLDVIFANHFGAYVGYSPEINLMPAPHAITPQGVVNKTTVEHIFSVGLRRDF